MNKKTDSTNKDKGKADEHGHAQKASRLPNPKKEEPKKKSAKKAIDPKNDFFTVDEDKDKHEEGGEMEEPEMEFIDENPNLEDLDSMDDDDDDEFFGEDDF